MRDRPLRERKMEMKSARLDPMHGLARLDRVAVSAWGFGNVATVVKVHKNKVQKL